MASYKRRQSSDYNQSVPETQFVPEQHAYQEKHFQPLLNQPVSESHAETEYGATVTPDQIESRAEKTSHSTYTEQSDQPGEDDMAKAQIRQNLQNNSDPGTQYSTPDVSSGVSSGPGGFAAAETSTAAAATSTVATTTVAANTAATTLTTVATATAGVAIITVAFILPLVVGVPSAIIFDEISVTDTTVYYSIYFEDYEEDMDLTVSLQNNFTNRSHTVESHSISVLEENLRPGMQYRLIVYGSMGAILGERTVTTEKDSPSPPTPPVTPTFDVEAAEFSTADGLIHLSATLDDPNGEYSDFSMVFYGVKGETRTEVKRVSVEDFTNEVTMLPGLATDTYVDGILAVECMDGTESKVLYEKQMTAYSNLYIGFKTQPRIIDGYMTVECTIVDTESARSNYVVTATVTNAGNPNDFWSDSGELVNGTKVFGTRLGYSFHTGSVTVSWDGEGSKVPLTCSYDTLTVGVATMKNDPISYEGTDYEVQFTVELILDDDFNYLVDSSGNWYSDKYPTLTSEAQSPLSNTFYEIRKTGDNTYLATFLAQSWNEAKMYRLDNTFAVTGFEERISMFTSDNLTSYTTSDENKNVSAVVKFYGGDMVEPTCVRAVNENYRVESYNISKDQTSPSIYTVTLLLNYADPYATYSIYFCDSGGTAYFREDNVSFEYPRLISATYELTTSQTSGEEVAVATIIFEYPVTPVYIPSGQSEIISSETPVTESGILTLEFTVAKDSPILTGDQYFHFAVADTTSSEYYWFTEFTQKT